MPSIKGARSSRRTGAAILLALLGHILIGLCMLKGPTAPQPGPPDVGPIFLTLPAQPALPASKVLEKPPGPSAARPPLPSDMPSDPQPASDATEAGPTPEESASLSPPAQDWVVDAQAPCDLLAGIQQRLQDDGSVSSALRALPTNSRSVANALMLWDGTWRQDGPPRPLAALRTALQRALAGAPDACLENSNAGPRLIMLRDDHGTTLLAIGSGVWRWSQLTATAPPPMTLVK